MVNRMNNLKSKNGTHRTTGEHSKMKVFAPSIHGGPDREVQVVYQRKAEYGRPSFLRVK